MMLSQWSDLWVSLDSSLNSPSIDTPNTLKDPENHEELADEIFLSDSSPKRNFRSFQLNLWDLVGN